MPPAAAGTELFVAKILSCFTLVSQTRIKPLFCIAVAALTASCQSAFLGSQTVVLKETGPDGVEITVKSPPGRPLANMIELDGRPLAVAPPQSGVTVFLNPPAAGSQTVILKDGDQDRLAISLVAPTAQVWSASVPSSQAALTSPGGVPLNITSQVVLAPDSPGALPRNVNRRPSISAAAG